MSFGGNCLARDVKTAGFDAVFPSFPQRTEESRNGYGTVIDFAPVLIGVLVVPDVIYPVADGAGLPNRIGWMAVIRTNGNFKNDNSLRRP